LYGEIDSLELYFNKFIDDSLTQKNKTEESVFFRDLHEGNYMIVAIDEYGCHSNYPISTYIDEPDSFYIEPISTRNIQYKDGKSGYFKFKTSGGNTSTEHSGAFAYLFDEAESLVRKDSGSFAMLSSIKNLSAGKYQLKIEDSKLCRDTHSFELYEPDEYLGFDVVELKRSGCKSRTGSVLIKGKGGWGDYKYSIGESVAKDTGYFPNKYSGKYHFKVMDKENAQFSDSITIYYPDSLDASLGQLITTPSYYNTNDGEQEVLVSGGVAPYKINGINSSIIPVKAGGNMIEIIDSLGCKFNLMANINAPEKLEIKAENNFTTCRVSDGIIYPTITGGILPYQSTTCKDIDGKSFSFGSEIKNLPSNIYILNVEDSQSHYDSLYVVLSSYSTYFKIVEIINCSENGSRDGRAKVYIENCPDSLQVYSNKGMRTLLNIDSTYNNFKFENDTISFDSLEQARYFIKLQDSITRCVTIIELSIEQPEMFKIKDVDILNSKTIDSDDGQISIEVEGGNGENNYLWEHCVENQVVDTIESDNFDNLTTISNLDSGTYKLTVSDKLGFKVYYTAKVKEPEKDLDITEFWKKNATCKFYTNGEIVVEPDGGWGDYQFRRDIYPETGYVNDMYYDNLDVRIHKIYTKDMMGVVDSLEFLITEPDSLRAKLKFVDSVNCKDHSDGEIHLAIRGGTEPYSLKFLDEADSEFYFDTVVRNLEDGYYVVNISDTNNCFSYDTVRAFVHEPDSLLFKSIETIHTTCEKENGEIQIAMQGGTRSYNYKWLNLNEPISRDSFIKNLLGNQNYVIEVLDRHNCFNTQTIHVNRSVNPVITQVKTKDVLCWSDTSGTAEVIVKPAIPIAPFKQIWSHSPDTTKIIGGLWKSKNHYVKVIDTNGCEDFKFYEISEPDTISTIANVSNAVCFGYADGFIELFPSGGVGNYKFLWSNNDSSQVAKNLTKGAYSVVITDSNNCKNSFAFKIVEPDLVDPHIGGIITVCENQYLSVDAGDYKEFVWNSPTGYRSEERFAEIVDTGYYYLEVRDSNYCLGFDTIILKNSKTVLQAEFLVPSTIRKGDTIIVHEISNNVPDSVIWEVDNEKFEIVSQTEQSVLIFAGDTSKCILNLYAYKAGCFSTMQKIIQVNTKDSTIGFDEAEYFGAQNSKIKKFTAYPNPAQSVLNMDVEVEQDGEYLINIYQLSSGAKVGELNGEVVDGVIEIRDYDISSFSNGLYYLILETADTRKRIKLMVTR
jgi:hypothetical protein